MQDEKRKDRSSVWIFGIPLLVVVAVAAFFLLRPLLSDGGAETMNAQPVVPTETVVEGEPAPVDMAESELERQWIEATGEPPIWPGELDDPRNCGEVIDDLRALCRRLDGRAYIHPWNLPGGTCGLMGDLTAAFEARPPTLDGLFDSIGSFRANVTHLYSVLGDQRLARVLTIVREEPEMAEPMAMALYRWARSAKRCADVSPAPPSIETQYDYATFLVNTIGGQAYLRRRAPRMEALVSFYAVLVLDNAVESGYNPAGVDLRPEIERAIALVATQDLLFRDHYLEILQDLRVSWEVRAREAAG